MKNYQKLELPALLQLLAEQTALYTKMLCMGGFNDEEFKVCRYSIYKLQVEIEHRKKEKGDNTAIIDPDIFFFGD